MFEAGIKFGNAIDRTANYPNFNSLGNATRTSTTDEGAARANGDFFRAAPSNLAGDLRRIGLERQFARLTGANAAAPVAFAERHRAAQGLRFSETKNAEMLAYTARAGEVYQFADGKRWRVVDAEDTPRTGFRAVVLRPVDANDRRVIVSFAGSGAQIGDWATNFGQAGGNTPAQYRQAVALAREYQREYGDNVILTGHSLGGGLASYASLQTGLRATAINSAALSPNNLGGNALFNPSVRDNPRITQYYAPGEILTDLDRIDLFDARPGNHVAVPGRYSPLDPRAPIGNHLLGNLAIDVPAPVRVNN